MRRSLAVLLLCLCSGCARAQEFGPGLGTSLAAQPQYPVTPPGNATVYANLEQRSGWSGDSTASVSGAYAPKVCSITPTGLGNPCPGAGTTAGGTYSGGGGGSTLTLATTGLGVPDGSYYSGWMAKLGVSTTGQTHWLLRGSITYNSGSGIASGTPGGLQAQEIGRRATNAAGITDNGQTQFVPIYPGFTQLEFDTVLANGSWGDTGCRFPMFVAATTYNFEIYEVNGTDGSLSPVYVSLVPAGSSQPPCVIPATYNGKTLQNIAGASLGWTPNELVAAFQPDANTSGDSFSSLVTLTIYGW